MSAKYKNPSAICSDRHHDASDLSYTFNLEHEDSIGFVFDQQQIKMEPEDHLENLFQSQFEAQKTLQVKEESFDVDYFPYSQNQKRTADPSLNDYFRSIKELQNKCRLVQQIILATASEAIYKYPIGFKAQKQKEADANRSMQQSYSNSYFLGQKEPQSFLVNHSPRNTEEKEHRLKEEDIAEDERLVKSVALLSVLDTKHSLHATQQCIQFASNCCDNPLTSNEKLYFLKLVRKLQCLSKGIERKMIATYEKDHRCKVCGLQFQTGRKLGGHISRKHPGNSYDYLMKKQIRRSKICERNRRKYLKNLQLEKGLREEGHEALR